MSVFKSLKAGIGKIYLKMSGWKCDRFPDIGHQFVLVGFPHDSNKDAPLGVAVSFYNKVQLNPFIKKEWFFWPMSWFLKAMGFIPIDRSGNLRIVDQVANEFKVRKKFVPAISPEGTRSDVKSIKTGFWSIAKKADVPIVMLYKDRKNKHIKILGHLKTSDSILDDLYKVRDAYKNAGYDIPMDGIEEKVEKMLNYESTQK